MSAVRYCVKNDDDDNGDEYGDKVSQYAYMTRNWVACC